jgi:hypothetical protein
MRLFEMTNQGSKPFGMNLLQNAWRIGNGGRKHIKNEGISQEVIENKRPISSLFGIT